MTWVTDFSLTIEKPKTDAFAPTGGWNEKICSKSPWQQAPVVAPAYQSDENLKKSFGIELAKAANAFEAGCKIAGDDTSKALWISANWLNDPVVIASRDVYLKTVALNTKPLDREQIAAKALAIADEKTLKNGIWVPTVEAKDRLAAIRLYTDIVGYTGKVEVDASTKNFTHNEMTIKLVKAEDKSAKPTIINNTPNIKSENVNEIQSPITLKLVGGVSR